MHITKQNTLVLLLLLLRTLDSYSSPPHNLQPQYRGKALPPDHKDSQLIQRIAERIISAVEEGHGGGFQKHIRKVRHTT
jgi:hypothetical protein